MLEIIISTGKCIKGLLDASVPVLSVGLGCIIFVWLAMLIWQARPFEKEIARFRSLTPANRVALLMLLCMFTWWGGAKESGNRGGSDGLSKIGNQSSRGQNSIQMRSLPTELVSTSNLLEITAFEVSHTNETVAFEISWATNLFDYTDSRELYLFASTNLQERTWFPMGLYNMPEGTNGYAFVISESNVESSMRQWFRDTFGGAGFYRFNIDFDSDNDGIADAIEQYWTLTDPDDPDTDGDGIDDSLEVNGGLNPLCDDSDSDGVLDGDEIGYIRKNSAFEWYSTEQLVPRYNNIGYWSLPVFGITGWWCATFFSNINSSHTLCGLLLRDSMVYETGYIAFTAIGDGNGWISPPSPMSLNQNIRNTGSIFVGAYWNQSYLAYGNTNSYIKAGNVADGSYVIEFHDVKQSQYSSLGMTYQVIVPPGTGNVIRVSYLSSDYWMDGVGAVVGVQNKRIVTPNGFYNLVWDFPERGPILPQTTIEFHLGFAINPVNEDSDGDGISDGDEIYVHGTSPRDSDTDSDGLQDGCEIDIGTDPLLADSDGDGLMDGEEIAAGSSPLVADTDGDGIVDGLEVNIYGSNPCVSDTDGDGISDLQELQIGTDLLNADTDQDGLSDGLEYVINLDPRQPDTDFDGMNDGWEYQYRNAGFNPAVDNASDNNPDNDIDSDPDGDGLSNGRECDFGCNPSGLDVNNDDIPDGYDTDGDGVCDSLEIEQNSDPTDPSDDGLPNSRLAVQFYFGDDSGSHSEKYRLSIFAIHGEGAEPSSFSWLNENYGAPETKKAMLKPGWKYEIRLYHAGTSPTYTGNPNPDYDYVLSVSNLNDIAGMVVNDPDGLFDGCNDGVVFVAEGKVATISVYAVTDVAICEPNDQFWPEMDESQVLLDDEVLRVKIRISPAIDTIDRCRDVLGSNIVVKTSDTCPQGVCIPFAADDIVNSSTNSEIRLSKSLEQLRLWGLLPLQNEDAVNEMSWLDVPETSEQNLSDSTEFSSLGYAFRGKAIVASDPNLEGSPPVSQRSRSFLKAAGCEIILASYGNVDSEKRQIMNQADYFYYSGHGSHYANTIQGNFSPLDVSGYWNRDLDVVIIAGCSVLDINDYNSHYEGSEHGLSPGMAWEQAGPSVLLGYNYYAPSDASGAPASIMATWVDNRAVMGDISAWMHANDNKNGRNACAIEKGSAYHYFHKVMPGFYIQRTINKEDW